MEIRLQPGSKGEARELVTQENTAKKYGSGSIEVYATPAMLCLMENAALKAVDSQLPEGYATVGTHLDVKHLKATPLGMNITAKAVLEEVNDRKLTFTVEAFDEKDLIGEGTHTRYIVEVEKFLEKAERKKNNQ